jgi:hypothetical protein
MPTAAGPTPPAAEHSGAAHEPAAAAAGRDGLRRISEEAAAAAGSEEVVADWQGAALSSGERSDRGHLRRRRRLPKPNAVQRTATATRAEAPTTTGRALPQGSTAAMPCARTERRARVILGEHRPRKGRHRLRARDPHRNMRWARCSWECPKSRREKARVHRRTHRPRHPTRRRGPGRPAPCWVDGRRSRPNRRHFGRNSDRVPRRQLRARGPSCKRHRRSRAIRPGHRPAIHDDDDVRIRETGRGCRFAFAHT